MTEHEQLNDIESLAKSVEKNRLMSVELADFWRDRLPEFREIVEGIVVAAKDERYDTTRLNDDALRFLFYLAVYGSAIFSEYAWKHDLAGLNGPKPPFPPDAKDIKSIDVVRAEARIDGRFKSLYAEHVPKPGLFGKQFSIASARIFSTGFRVKFDLKIASMDAVNLSYPDRKILFNLALFGCAVFELFLLNNPLEKDNVQERQG